MQHRRWNMNILFTIGVGVVVVTVVGKSMVQSWDRSRRSRRKHNNNNNDDDDDNDDDDTMNNTSTATTTTNTTIYMDYNGTTPIYDIVYKSMIPYLTKYYGNPSSSHSIGTIPAQAIQYARYQILHYLLKCPNVEYTSKPQLPSSSPSSSSSSSPPSSSTQQQQQPSSPPPPPPPSQQQDPSATTAITPLSSCIFTSCGTEADNMILSIAIQLWKIRNTNNNNNTNTNTTTTLTTIIPHIITTNIEHPAIEVCLQMYERTKQCIVIRVPVNKDGQINTIDMIHTIQQYQSTCALVTMMLANNETGVVQPVKEIATYIRTTYPPNTILFATDVAQATGKISITIHDLGHPDMIVIVGHKFGAPKGIACLYIRPGCLSIPSLSNRHPTQQQQQQPIYGLLLGGGQEYNWRGGTSNVPYIVGLGVAAEYAQKNLIRNAQHMELMRTRLLHRIQTLIGEDNIRVHGPTDSKQRLPNTLSIGFGNGIHSGILLHDLRDVVAASAGATCHSANGPISSILQAMQIPDIWARGTIRLSLGPSTTTEDVDRAAIHIADAVQRQWENNKKGIK